MFYTTDKDGNLTHYETYPEWVAGGGTWNQDRIVATDFVGDIAVSTVFLAVSPEYPPYLWETMVFGGVMDGYQERYLTKKAAEKGHTSVLELVRSSLLAPAVPASKDEVKAPEVVETTAVKRYFVGR